MSIDPKFVELTPDVLENIFYKIFNRLFVYLADCNDGERHFPFFFCREGHIISLLASEIGSIVLVEPQRQVPQVVDLSDSAT